VGAVLARVQQAGVDLAVVVNTERVVLGMLRAKQLAASPALLVDVVMDPAPSTYRPNVSIDEMVRHLRGTTARRVLVSTADGILIGLLTRESCFAHASEEEGRAGRRGQAAPGP
jgi:hypothetical protein